MKPVLPLQFLLVLGLALQLVPGSPRHHFLKYILEPPPCRSEPENCASLCTLQEDCQEGFQCCSAFCGIVCSSDKIQKRKKKIPSGLGVAMPDN
ncbi:WAP four-disulfide core domain protein 13 precursor [Daubentonia madagascariensis]|uniref:WAP four-disulfide core domain protein 13 n=1 Tax=Daubentonia madagascariensis TaxID=31869 RepID=A0ABD2DAI1_DAUMA